MSKHFIWIMPVSKERAGGVVLPPKTYGQGTPTRCFRSLPSSDFETNPSPLKVEGQKKDWVVHISGKSALGETIASPAI
jgi:hypothetical protein